MLPDIFGLGKAISTGIIVAALAGSAVAVYSYWDDQVGDKRESQLRQKALEDRLKGIRDANEREKQRKALPAFAKVWCAVDGSGSDCCKPDAVSLPRCTHDPASDLPRPN